MDERSVLMARYKVFDLHVVRPARQPCRREFVHGRQDLQLGLLADVDDLNARYPWARRDDDSFDAVLLGHLAQVMTRAKDRHAVDGAALLSRSSSTKPTTCTPSFDCAGNLRGARYPPPRTIDEHPLQPPPLRLSSRTFSHSACADQEANEAGAEQHSHVPITYTERDGDAVPEEIDNVEDGRRHGSRKGQDDEFAHACIVSQAAIETGKPEPGQTTTTDTRTAQGKVARYWDGTSPSKRIRNDMMSAHATTTPSMSANNPRRTHR